VLDVLLVPMQYLVNMNAMFNDLGRMALDNRDTDYLGEIKRYLTQVKCVHGSGGKNNFRSWRLYRDDIWDRNIREFRRIMCVCVGRGELVKR